MNLIRLPPSNATTEELANMPILSAGEETEKQYTGWYGVGGISLLVMIIVFTMLVRRPDSVRDSTFSPKIEINSGGLPTHVDESGVTWRQHPDGTVDWWDEGTMIWQRW